MTGHTLPTPPAAVVREAAAWMARLWSDEASAADEAACAHWRAADPAHERAWRQLLSLDDKLAQVPREVASQVLREPAATAYLTRRKALRLLGLGFGVGGSAVLLRESGVWQAATSELATATGEIRAVALPDGSQLTLGTATRVDLHFGAAERRLVLHAGEILVDTVGDPARPPFRVKGRHGLVEARGGRFSLRQDATTSQLAVLDGSAALYASATPETPLGLEAGQGLRFSAASAGTPAPLRGDASAWTRGVLVAEAMRVADFLTELGRYRPGLLRCDPAVAELRVSGVFSLRDTDRALHNLALALPLAVVYRTRYWVTVEAAAAMG